MALDMFLKLEGIDGEARDKAHAKEIDVLAWSWGASQSGTFHVGGGGGAGKANFQDLSVTKWIDRSTPDLLHHLATGKPIDEARLVVRRAGDKPFEYLVLTFKRVLVTSLAMGGSGGEDRLTELISLNFAEFHLQYVEQTETGSVGAKPDFGWDISGNHLPGRPPPPPPPVRSYVPPAPVIEESVIEESVVEDSPVEENPCGEGQVMVDWPGGGRDCMPIGWDDSAD